MAARRSRRFRRSSRRHCRRSRSQAGASSAAKVGPTSLAVIDPKSNKVVDTIDLGFKSSLIAAGEGSVWVVDPQGSTLVKIDPRTRTGRQPDRDLGRCGAIPFGLAAGQGAVWVAVLRGTKEVVLELGPDVGDLRRTIPYGSTGTVARSLRLRPLAVGAGAVWAIDPRPGGRLAHPSADRHGAEVDRWARRPLARRGARRCLGGGPRRATTKIDAVTGLQLGIGPGGLSGHRRDGVSRTRRECRLVCDQLQSDALEARSAVAWPSTRPSRSATARVTSPSAREQRGWRTAATHGLASRSARRPADNDQPRTGARRRGRRLRSRLDEPGRAALLSYYSPEGPYASCGKGAGGGAPRMARVVGLAAGVGSAGGRRVPRGPAPKGRDASAQLDSRRRLRRPGPRIRPAIVDDRVRHLRRALQLPGQAGASGSDRRPGSSQELPDGLGDGKTQTIQLNRTFRFHTGARVTAANFVAAFNRDANPKLQSPVVSAGYLRDIVGADAVIAGKALTISGVTGARPVHAADPDDEARCPTWFRA